MDKHTPVAGDEVYDIHGRAASYVALTSSGHVVEPIYEHEDYAPTYGKPETWSEVFATPPVEKLHAEVAELQKQVAASRTELNAIHDERMAMDRAFAARKAERAQFDQLKTLDDFIAGKITHFFVVEGYGEHMSIQTFDDFMKETSERYGRKLRLLSLCGESNGDLSWRVDSYSDGSGGSHGRCFPALSFEEAVTHAAKWLDIRYIECRKQERKHSALSLANEAAKFHLPVPDDIAEWAKQQNESHNRRMLEEARQTLAKAKARVEELEFGGAA